MIVKSENHRARRINNLNDEIKVNVVLGIGAEEFDAVRLPLNKLGRVPPLRVGAYRVTDEYVDRSLTDDITVAASVAGVLGKCCG